jgi:antirestriction protein ArdC
LDFLVVQWGPQESLIIQVHSTAGEGFISKLRGLDMPRQESAAKMDVYEIITSNIMKLLEEGVVPWRRPWDSLNFPKSMVSGKEYRGMNVLILAATAQMKGYTSPWWITFKQAKKLGGYIRRGEKGTAIIHWNVREYEAEDGTMKKSVRLHYWTVFNIEQCEKIEAPTASEREPFEPIDRASEIVACMRNLPVIEHGRNRAFYRPSTDTVGMPNQNSFYSREEYYSTLFHELVHSTGHESRVGRDGIMNGSFFGDHEYSKEELVAEMGAAFLCGHCNIHDATIENSTAYIQSWLRALQNDKKMLVHAASAGQKAADYIMGKVREENNVEETAEA